MRRRKKLERTLETACLRHARGQGNESRKMNGLGFAAWPDRLFLPINMAAPWTSPGHVLWVEFKREGEGPTPAQADRHDALRCSGQEVHVVDRLEQFKAILRDFNRDTTGD